VSVHFSRSLKHVAPPGAAAAVDLLATSDKAFAVTSILGAADWKDLPTPKPTDPKGTLVLAMASERPKVGKDAAHGPRVVVLGSGSFFVRQNWEEPMPLRGAVYVVESAISWLASKPEILDVPQKPEISAGIRINEESRSEVRRYVLVFMPLAVALLGVAVALRRRSTEGAPRKKSKE
jgi:hypothetical protein